jgi:ferric iron reductase protein FhuF
MDGESPTQGVTLKLYKDQKIDPIKLHILLTDFSQHYSLSHFDDPLLSGWFKKYIGAFHESLFIHYFKTQEVPFQLVEEHEMVFKEGIATHFKFSKTRPISEKEFIDHYFFEVLPSLIKALNSRIKSEILWGNAANSLFHLLLEWEEETEFREQALHFRKLFFDSKMLNNKLNPYHGLMELKQVQDFRLGVRKVCCMKCLLPGGSHCYTCPNISENLREMILRKKGLIPEVTVDMGVSVPLSQ